VNNLVLLSAVNLGSIIDLFFVLLGLGGTDIAKAGVIGTKKGATNSRQEVTGIEVQVVDSGQVVAASAEVRCCLTQAVS